jgi:TonB family protein
MIEQAPVSEPEQKPDAAPKPEEPPAAPLGTGIAGPGSDALGLSGHGNGGGYGPGGNGTGGRGGSRWGWYAGQVQNRIAEAIRNNRKTRNASMHVDVRIWPDNTGRITRATISGSTGDAAVDAALKNEVLTGLRLSEPPPEGMPTPIVIRLTARRPN